MNDKVEIHIWGRDFSLPIDYDCFDDESPTKVQIEALKKFKLNTDLLKDSKKRVEKYCRNEVLEDAENTKKDNIFSYIKPAYIFVKREHENPRIALMCNYRYDEEHGLAIVFNNNGKISVGSQDIIL